MQLQTNQSTWYSVRVGVLWASQSEPAPAVQPFTCGTPKTLVCGTAGEKSEHTLLWWTALLFPRVCETPHCETFAGTPLV